MRVPFSRPLLSALALAAALAGCVAPPAPPRPAPTRAPAPPPPPPPGPLAADWQDWPYTPGTWTYRRDARGSIALFGAGGDDALVTLRCDRQEARLYLSRAGTIATPLTIRTTSATRAVPVQPTGGQPPYVALALAPGDPLLDAMGFSRGRIAIEQAGSPALVLPAWAEIERVTEDCRG